MEFREGFRKRFRKETKAAVHERVVGRRSTPRMLNIDAVPLEAVEKSFFSFRRASSLSRFPQSVGRSVGWFARCSSPVRLFNNSEAIFREATALPWVRGRSFLPLDVDPTPVAPCSGLCRRSVSRVGGIRGDDTEILLGTLSGSEGLVRGEQMDSGASVGPKSGCRWGSSSHGRCSSSAPPSTDRILRLIHNV